MAPLGSISIALASISIFAELYTRLPQILLFGSNPKSLPDDITNEHVFILFPGAGGADNNTNNILYEANKILNKTNSYYITCYDWKHWRGNFLRAAVDSETVGKRLGKQLAQISITNKQQIGRAHV